MVSHRILPYDVSEGLNEEEAQLAAGREMIDAGRQPEGTGPTSQKGKVDKVILSHLEQ